MRTYVLISYAVNALVSFSSVSRILSSIRYLAPLAGPVAALVSALIWQRGLRRYQGTGH